MRILTVVTCFIWAACVAVTEGCHARQPDGRFWGGRELMRLSAWEGAITHFEWQDLHLQGPQGLLPSILSALPEKETAGTTSGVEWPGLPSGQSYQSFFKARTNEFTPYAVGVSYKEAGLSVPLATDVSMLEPDLPISSPLSVHVGCLELVSSLSELEESLGEPGDLTQFTAEGMQITQAKWLLVIGKAPRRTLMTVSAIWKDTAISRLWVHFFYEDQVIRDLRLGQVV